MVTTGVECECMFVVLGIIGGFAVVGFVGLAVWTRALLNELGPAGPG